LQTGGLQFGNTQDGLEVGVENIEKTVRETPEKEQERDEEDWVGKLPASQESSFDGAPRGDCSASSHYQGRKG